MNDGWLNAPGSPPLLPPLTPPIDGYTPHVNPTRLDMGQTVNVHGVPSSLEFTPDGHVLAKRNVHGVLSTLIEVTSATAPGSINLDSPEDMNRAESNAAQLTDSRSSSYNERERYPRPRIDTDPTLEQLQYYEYIGFLSASGVVEFSLTSNDPEYLSGLETTADGKPLPHQVVAYLRQMELKGYKAPNGEAMGIPTSLEDAWARARTEAMNNAIEVVRQKTSKGYGSISITETDLVDFKSEFEDALAKREADKAAAIAKRKADKEVDRAKLYASYTPFTMEPTKTRYNLKRQPRRRLSNLFGLLD